MPQISTYDYQFHGGPSGYQNSRAILRLYGADGTTLAYIHFVPTGQAIPPDLDAAPWMRMYMPEALISSVLEMLRDEEPVSVYWAASNGFLHTGSEPVGENDPS
jgi:hypothetical protein